MYVHKKKNYLVSALESYVPQYWVRIYADFYIYMCVCIYIYRYMYIRPYVCMCICLHAHSYIFDMNVTYMHILKHTHTPTYLYIHMYIYMNTTDTHIHQHPRIIHIRTQIDRKNPPPRGGSLFAMFPHQEPCVRGPPSKDLYQVLRGGPLAHGS